MLTATKRTFKLFLVTLITVVFVMFAVVNREVVHLSLFPLPYTAEMPAFIFAVICFSLGLIVGWIVVSLKLMKSQRLLKSQHKHVMALQNEVGVMKAATQSNVPVAK